MRRAETTTAERATRSRTFDVVVDVDVDEKGRPPAAPDNRTARATDLPV